MGRSIEVKGSGICGRFSVDGSESVLPSATHVLESIQAFHLNQVERDEHANANSRLQNTWREGVAWQIAQTQQSLRKRSEQDGTRIVVLCLLFGETVKENLMQYSTSGRSRKMNVDNSMDLSRSACNSVAGCSEITVKLKRLNYTNFVMMNILIGSERDFLKWNLF